MNFEDFWLVLIVGAVAFAAGHFTAGRPEIWAKIGAGFVSAGGVLRSLWNKAFSRATSSATPASPGAGWVDPAKEAHASAASAVAAFQEANSVNAKLEAMGEAAVAGLNAHAQAQIVQPPATPVADKPAAPVATNGRLMA